MRKLRRVLTLTLPQPGPADAGHVGDGVILAGQIRDLGEAPAELTGDWVVDENYQPVDVAELTAEEIIGSDVRTADGEVVATVADMVFSSDGKAESVAAKFGGFLGFGSNTVLLKLDEVEFMRNDAGTVVLRTAITPESLEGRPDYEG